MPFNPEPLDLPTLAPPSGEPEPAPAPAQPFFVLGGPLSLDELRRLYIARVIELTRGNYAEAARILGVDRKTMWRWRRDGASPLEEAHS